MAYTPEYYNQLQQYYSAYLPGQQLNTAGLQNWYAGAGDIPYGGTSFAPAATSTQGLFSGMGEGGSAGDAGGLLGGGPATDDVGLAQSTNISPIAVSLAATLGSLLGIPGMSLVSLNNRALANALTNMGYNSAVAQNVATVAAQLGLDPSNPANAAAISAAIDSLSGFSAGTTSATTGPAGTGGAAASASAAAAEAAAAAGYGAAAQGAAAQAAADAVLGGASAEDAAAAGLAAGFGAEFGASDLSGDFGLGASDFGASDLSGDFGGGYGGGDLGGDGGDL